MHGKFVQQDIWFKDISVKVKALFLRQIWMKDKYMATSKALVICLAALLVCLVFIESSNATTIGYDPIRRGGSGNPCLGKPGCLPPPANPYGRGCPTNSRCRRSPPSPARA